MADDPRAGELTTTNYHWTKPTVGQSDDAWGGYLNADLDSIDSIVHGIDTRVIPPGGAIVSDTPPASPTPGMLWFDSVGGQTYVWYSDPNTSQWVLAVSAAQGPQGPQGPAGPNTLPMGVTDGSNAAAGQIGEIISSVVTTGVPLTTGTAVNVASITLTPGDWDVSGEVWFTTSASTATGMGAGIGTTSAAHPTVPSVGTSRMIIQANPIVAGIQCLALTTCRASLSANVVYYLTGNYVFPSGAVSATGRISARRVR